MSGQQEDIILGPRTNSRVEAIKRAVKFSIGLQKVTGHRGGVSPLQNERRGVKRPAIGKDDDGGTP
jgi:hypothetical protein